MIALLASANTAYGFETVFQLNIPAIRASEALDRLAEKTRHALFYPTHELKSVKTKQLKGLYTLPEALRILLEGTPLRAVVTPKGVIVISMNIDGANDKRRAWETNSMKTKRNILAAAVGVALSGGVIADEGDATSEDLGWMLEEVVVTAQKREERLIDVPISISAISGEALDNAHIQNIGDLSFAVPNLSITENAPGYQTIVVRGVGNVLGSSVSVGVFLDEIPVSNDPFYTPDLQVLDLKRAEVLKGPQGTLYGQGSMGGAIRYITNDPSFEGIEGQLTLSAYSTRKGSWSEEFTGFINIPIIEDTLGFRISGTYKDKSGWIDQPLANREDINDSELTNIRIKGLWQISDDLSVKATVIRHRNDYEGLNIVNNEPYGQSNYQQAVFRTEPVVGGLSNAEGGVSNYDLYNLTISYDFNFATLFSVTSLSDRETNTTESQLREQTIGPIEFLAVNIYAAGNSFSQDLRLVSSRDTAFDWTLGIFYTDLETEFDNDHFWSIHPCCEGINDFGRYPRDITSESIAYYGDLSYTLTDQLTVGVGMRYFEDDRTRINFYGDANGILREEDFDNLSSRIYLSYALADEVNIYASVSEGFRSGGFSDVAATKPIFEPELLTAYELGVKSVLLNNRLRNELAFFYSDYTDYIVNSFDPITLVVTTDNAGEAVVKGIEWSLEWSASDQLNLGFNGAVTEGEFTKINTGVKSNITGDSLPHTPKYSFSVYADYNFNWSRSVPGVFRLNYNRVGKSSITNRDLGLINPTPETETFGFLNTQISAQWQSFSVELFADNLLDENRVTNASLYGRQTPQHRPRSIGLAFSFDF